LTLWHTSAEPIPADHPCLPGHFPDHPIVPGTLMLERVIDCLSERYAVRQVCEVVSAKFLAPLEPEQAFTIHFDERGDAANFECRQGETILACGKLKLTQRVLGTR
jgi:3-hydroxymyristoyl/3-hydroxydecanoyl-(acyl carrier protein) dehydratase